MGHVLNLQPSGTNGKVHCQRRRRLFFRAAECRRRASVWGCLHRRGRRRRRWGAGRARAVARWTCRGGNRPRRLGGPRRAARGARRACGGGGSASTGVLDSIPRRQSPRLHNFLVVHLELGQQVAGFAVDVHTWSRRAGTGTAHHRRNRHGPTGGGAMPDCAGTLDPAPAHGTLRLPLHRGLEAGRAGRPLLSAHSRRPAQCACGAARGSGGASGVRTGSTCGLLDSRRRLWWRSWICSAPRWGDVRGHEINLVWGRCPARRANDESAGGLEGPSRLVQWVLDIKKGVVQPSTGPRAGHRVGREIIEKAGRHERVEQLVHAVHARQMPRPAVGAAAESRAGALNESRGWSLPKNKTAAWPGRPSAPPYRTPPCRRTAPLAGAMR
eukprot:scaffold276_cov116-Isochrysis_galbana.AAC.10